ncbi:hypothetical protein RRG08_014338 [Elysia crispata]|uniref:Uncharacterized protein n=1 Tax=Elysia crispata TaxID=231223 RepID=A0AAE1CJC1_9GAST|nr:hypothetical protein RRG08_014338 [Elysia crispata]
MDTVYKLHNARWGMRSPVEMFLPSTSLTELVRSTEYFPYRTELSSPRDASDWSHVSCFRGVDWQTRRGSFPLVLFTYAYGRATINSRALLLEGLSLTDLCAFLKLRQ